MLIHHDLLACGPLPPIESMEQWRRVREGYLQTLDPEDASCAFEGQPRDLFTNRERLRTATRITLWVGTGLGEQLLLLWTVALLRHLAVDRTICRIIQFGYEGRNEIVCVGVLNPAQ